MNPSRKKSKKPRKQAKCPTISKSPKVLKWPRAGKRPRLRLFVVSEGSPKKGQPGKAREPINPQVCREAHKFWTDCPACSISWKG